MWLRILARISHRDREGERVCIFFEGLDEKGRSKKMHTLAPEGRLSRRTVELARALNALRDEGVKAHFLRLIRDFERIG